MYHDRSVFIDNGLYCTDRYYNMKTKFDVSMNLFICIQRLGNPVSCATNSTSRIRMAAVSQQQRMSEKQRKVEALIALEQLGTR